MTLYALKREYEERRQALIETLENNTTLDPEVQHQLYGAVKEIENFLETIDFQIKSDQANRLDIELTRDRPRPFVERTKKTAGKVKRGTSRMIKEHIPRVAKKVTAGPRRYLRRRKELRRVRREIEREVHMRIQGDSGLPSLPRMEEPGGMSGTITSVDISNDPHETATVRVGRNTDFAEEEPRRAPKRKAAKKVKRRKAVRKKAKRKAVKKRHKKKPPKKKTKRKPARKKAKRRR